MASRHPCKQTKQAVSGRSQVHGFHQHAWFIALPEKAAIALDVNIEKLSQNRLRLVLRRQSLKMPPDALLRIGAYAALTSAAVCIANSSRRMRTGSPAHQQTAVRDDQGLASPSADGSHSAIIASSPVPGASHLDQTPYQVWQWRFEAAFSIAPKCPPSPGIIILLMSPGKGPSSGNHLCSKREGQVCP
jgi:hypothetical protein